MLTSYHDYYNKKFLTKSWTRTHVFCLITAYIALAIPFYFSFGGSNFWLDNNTKTMTANYNYTGLYTIQVNLYVSTTFTVHEYSNIPGNGLPVYAGKSAALVVDDQMSAGSVSLQLNGYTDEISTVNVIMYYQVSLPDLGKILVTGLMWTIKGNVLAGRLSGYLKFNSQTSISAMTSNSIINLPPYYPHLTSGFTYTNLANELIATSTILENSFDGQTVAGTSSLRSVTYDFVKIRAVTVNYYPAILQTFKFKYSRYLGFAIISYYVFSTLLGLYIREGMLDCHTIIEKTH